MQRVAFRLLVKADKLDEYKRLHREVWPELLRDMHEASIRNYSIFSHGPELFGTFECDDYATTMATLSRSDANRRWQALMGAYLATPVDPGQAEPLELLEEIFRME